MHTPGRCPVPPRCHDPTGPRSPRLCNKSVPRPASFPSESDTVATLRTRETSRRDRLLRDTLSKGSRIRACSN
eukprot:763598-Hanusia_phi.AAC.6